MDFQATPPWAHLMRETVAHEGDDPFAGQRHPMTCGGNRSDDAHKRYAEEHGESDYGILVDGACPVCGWKQPKDIGTQLHEAKQEITRLRSLLAEAREDVDFWGGYASEYFQEKWDLTGTLEKYDAVIAETPTTPPQESPND